MNKDDRIRQIEAAQTILVLCRDCGRAVDDDGYTIDPHGCCFTCKAD